MAVLQALVGAVTFLATLGPATALAAGPVIKIESVERTVNAIVITGMADLVPVGTKFSAKVLAINGKPLNDPAKMIIAGAEKFEVPENRRFEVQLQRYGSLDAFDFPVGKYEVEFLAHFNRPWQSVEVLKAVGVPLDDQGRSGLDSEPRKLPPSPDLKRVRGIGGVHHRILETVRTVSVKSLDAPRALGRTKSIWLEIHDLSASVKRNPVRTLRADDVLQRDVPQVVGRITASQAIVLACKGPFPMGYIANDLYFSGGRANREMAGEHATTLREACFKMEQRCRAC